MIDYWNHRYRKAKNRLLKSCYVPATSAAQNRLLFYFFAAAVYSTTEANKASLKQSIILRCLWCQYNKCRYAECCGTLFSETTNLNFHLFNRFSMLDTNSEELSTIFFSKKNAKLIFWGVGEESQVPHFLVTIGVKV
jgi:hypothetical protein